MMEHDKSLKTDGYASRFGKPFFSSLWKVAWGEQYPEDIQPFSSCTRQLLSELHERIIIVPNKSIVDLGCGTGGLSLWLTNQFKSQVIGIDKSYCGIEISKQRSAELKLDNKVHFQVSEFDKTELEDNSVGCIVSIDALPFSKDIDNTLCELNRVLVMKGQLLFTTRALKPDTEKANNFGVLWDKALERNGFKVIEVYKRTGVSELWRAIYDEWVKNEQLLRNELDSDAVDKLLAEVSDVGPRLNENRDWLLITAVKVA